MARLPIRALKGRTQVGDNLAMPSYRDLLALLRFAEKLGELVFCFRDGIRGHSGSSLCILAINGQNSGAVGFRQDASSCFSMRLEIRPSTADGQAVRPFSFGRPWLIDA